MTPLPVTVISGYLGSGKTCLINHLLSHADGRRIMVLVNDFGELSIDAELLVNAAEDTLMGVQLVKGLEPWHRHQEVPAAVADEAFHLALVVALARATEAILKQVVGPQL